MCFFVTDRAVHGPLDLVRADRAGELSGPCGPPRQQTKKITHEFLHHAAGISR